MTELNPFPEPDASGHSSTTPSVPGADAASSPSASAVPATAGGRQGRRWIWKVASVFLAVALLLSGGAGWLYWESRQVPDFYEAAVRQSQPIPAEELRKTVARVTRETQEVLERRPGDEQAWDLEITPEELNAWLVEELPGLIGSEWPEALKEPRVAFEENRVLVGAVVTVPAWQGVASLSLRPMLNPPRTVLLEIESFKIGKVSVPLERLVAEIPQLEKSPHLQKNAKSGKYVLRVPLDSTQTKSLQMETLDVTPMRLRVTGH